MDPATQQAVAAIVQRLDLMRDELALTRAAAKTTAMWMTFFAVLTILALMATFTMWALVLEFAGT